jgi:hypothetical protein
LAQEDFIVSGEIYSFIRRKGEAPGGAISSVFDFQFWVRRNRIIRICHYRLVSSVGECGLPDWVSGQGRGVRGIEGNNLKP